MTNKDEIRRLSELLAVKEKELISFKKQTVRDLSIMTSLSNKIVALEALNVKLANRNLELLNDNINLMNEQSLQYDKKAYIIEEPELNDSGIKREGEEWKI